MDRAKGVWHLWSKPLLPRVESDIPSFLIDLLSTATGCIQRHDKLNLYATQIRHGRSTARVIFPYTTCLLALRINVAVLAAGPGACLLVGVADAGVNLLPGFGVDAADPFASEEG